MTTIPTVLAQMHALTSALQKARLGDVNELLVDNLAERMYMLERILTATDSAHSKPNELM